MKKVSNLKLENSIQSAKLALQQNLNSIQLLDEVIGNQIAIMEALNIVMSKLDDLDEPTFRK